MSGSTFADVDTFGNLKELYADDVVYQEYVMSSFFNHVRKATKDEVEFDGKNWNIGVTFQINESYGAKNDGERLPDPNFQKGVFAQYRPKLMYSQIESTTFAATRGYKNGRPNGKYLDDTIKGTLLSFSSNLDSDAYANGFGYRATISTATPAATSFTVTFSTRVRPGMLLDWYDATYTTKRGTIAIALKGVDRINRTVFVDTTYGSMAVPAGAVAGDVLVVQDALAPGTPSDGRNMAGFDFLTDNSKALGGLSPSTYAAWAATVVNAGLANPNQEILQQFEDQFNAISGLYPTKGSMNPVWKRGYLSGFLGQRRFTSNAYDTGASSLSWSPVRMGKDESGKKPQMIDWLEDKNCDPSLVLLWNDTAVAFAADYADEPHLADEDGAEFRYRIGFDSMQGFIRYWGNMVSPQRNGIGKIYNFNVGAGVI